MTTLESRLREPKATPSASPPPAPKGKETPTRLVSLDAYRGFIMLAMASAGLSLYQVSVRLETRGPELVATAVAMAGSPATGPLQAASSVLPHTFEIAPPSPVWHFLGFHTEHVPWIGCSFWDLIQPSFMFMVGVALPFSVASRLARGDSWWKIFFHAIWRAVLLILLAVFLSSPGARPAGYRWPTTNWVFTNVLAQIGLGYAFVFLLVGRGWRVQSLALLGILAGYTLLFGLFPAPGPSYDWQAVHVPEDWPHLTGWFAHWDKNSNVAHFFDLWFLNLFQPPKPFEYNHGGYQTLNFIPSMATMILGLMAGEMLRLEGWSKNRKLAALLIAAVVCLGVGWLMGETVCPIVKRIWTPSWAVYSAGWTFALLACFFLVIDVLGYRKWAFPLLVVGMNSIAMYCMSQLLKPWVRGSLQTHVGTWAFEGVYGPIATSAAILLVLWLFCFWMYRQKIFLRI